jgi:lantibiotic biosynthesis protein
MPLTFANFVVVRTPLLPFSRIDSSINECLSKPEFAEALFLATPELFVEVNKYFSGSLAGKDKERLELAIHKYFLRASYRCTPFGLFGGISIATSGKETTLTGCDQLMVQKRLVLDHQFMKSLANLLLTDNVFRNQVLFFPNNTLYRSGAQIRFVESRWTHELTSYHLSSIVQSEFVEMVLSKCQNGATLNELAACLQQDDITREDAHTFVEELINSGLLVSDFTVWWNTTAG